VEQEGKKIRSLDELLDAIHPSRAYDSYRNRIDEALRDFPYESFPVNNWGSCDRFVANFFARINAAIMGSAFGESAEFAMITFRNMFRARYGEYPERTLYDRMINGYEGGRNGFVKEAIETAVGVFAHTHITYRVDEFLDGLSDDEFLPVAEEYVAKWGNFLPRERIAEGAHRYPPFLREFLVQHPNLVLRLRSIH